jgi:membrane fusion protein (multidrug efflux system)
VFCIPKNFIKHLQTHFQNNKNNNLMRTIILVLAATTILYSCGDKQQEGAPAQTAVSLPVMRIHNGTATTTSEYPATIEGAVDIEIRPQVGGNLEKLYVDEGAYVTKGQPLFKINELPYREQLNNALANLHGAEATLINAQLEVEKLTPLVANKVVSDYQLKSAQAFLTIAQANVGQAKAMVGTANINLGYTLIKAPVDGYIGRLPKKQGSLVSPSDVEPLTFLSDVREVHVYFSLGETDFIGFKSQYSDKSLEDGTVALPPVSLLLADNSTYAERGQIDMVAGQFDKNTGAITVRATFPNSKGLLRSGNTGRVSLGVAHENTLLIPQEATMEVQDKIFVFALDKDNKVSKKPINVIGKSGTDYLVGAGVKSGDRIVYKGFEYLQDGAVVAPEKMNADLVKN